MEEKNKKVSLLSFDSVGIIQKVGFGSHSYTAEETKTMSYISKEIIKKEIKRVPLELKNNGKNRYFLVENGIVFKYDTEKFLFYQLNLEKMKWQENQYLASLFYDSYLKFQELLDFKDYYDNDDQLDLNSGRHLWFIQ